MKQKAKFTDAMFGFNIGKLRVVVDYTQVKGNLYDVEIRDGNERNQKNIRINHFANKTNAKRLLETYYGCSAKKNGA